MSVNGLEQALGRKIGTGQQARRDEDLFDDVIDGLMIEVPDVLDRLQEAVQARDMPKLAVLAHSLRGPLGLLRAGTLSLLVWDLEESAKAGDEERASNAAEVLVQKLRDLIIFLKDSS